MTFDFFHHLWNCHMNSTTDEIWIFQIRISKMTSKSFIKNNWTRLRHVSIWRQKSYWFASAIYVMTNCIFYNKKLKKFKWLLLLLWMIQRNNKIIMKFHVCTMWRSIQPSVCSYQPQPSPLVVITANVVRDNSSHRDQPHPTI